MKYELKYNVEEVADAQVDMLWKIANELAELNSLKREQLNRARTGEDRLLVDEAVA